MDSSKNIRVVVRVRPPNTREMEQNQRTIIKCQSASSLIFDPDEDEDEFFFHGAKQFHRDITRKQNKKLVMEFDQLFDEVSVNADVFNAAMKPLVQSVMDGFNCSAFVYGATGAGKTYTMLGSDDQPGITYLTMAYLFEQITSLSEERKFDIGISYLEVYNEQVMNLLTKSGPLKLREDTNGVVVSDLRLMPIQSATELLNLLAVGNKNRTQHPTDANAESSRSHAIFQVHIRMINRISGQKNTVKLSMIDLAGSERAASTKGIGQRFKEGASINKSLLALGNCINKLADGAKHIPYRDSNLTRIIKDSLGGNCQTVMIANVSPSSLTYEDTYNTLKYASRAKKIRSSVRLNICKINTPKEVLVKQVNEQHDELLKLREKNKALEVRLAAAESSANAKPAVSTNKTEMSCAGLMAAMAPWCERIDDVYSVLIKLMERSLRIDSNDKVAQFRKDIKGYTEHAVSALLLDGQDVKAELARLAASIEVSDKNSEAQKLEVKRCRERIAEKRIELTILTKSMNECEFAPLLQQYMAGKQHEFESIRTNMKMLHILKINQVYYGEIHHLQKIVKDSSQIIQDDFYLLQGRNLLDTNMRKNLENLKLLATGKRDSKSAKNAEYKPTAAHNITIRDPSAPDVCDDEEGEDEYEDEDMDAPADDMVDLEMDDKATHHDPNETATVKRPMVGPPVGLATVVKKPILKTRMDILPRPPINVRSGPLAAAAARAVAIRAAARAISSTDNTSAEEAMDVDVSAQPSVSKPSAQFNLNAKNSQIRSKQMLLRNILSDNLTNPLFNKVTKVIAKTPAGKYYGLSKENKRLSPVRRSPRSKTPRQNNASRARQRMLTGAPEPSNAAAALKQKLLLIPKK